jgi:hypothetical protein
VPTYSSWLNWIECEFAALPYFALNGTDHRSHGEQDDAIGTYIRWRNQHAQPKRGFAVNPRSGCPITYRTLLDEALDVGLGPRNPTSAIIASRANELVSGSRGPAPGGRTRVVGTGLGPFRIRETPRQRDTFVRRQALRGIDVDAEHNRRTAERSLRLSTVVGVVPGYDATLPARGTPPVQAQIQAAAVAGGVRRTTHPLL